MSDEREDSPRTPPAPAGANGAGPGAHELDRMPPPAFPPGRGHAPRGRLHEVRREAGGSADAGGGVPDDAFISPDEPIVRSGSRIAAGAFISPDEPLPPRDAADEPAGEVEEGEDEGVVTGIGDDPHLAEEDLAFSRYADPHVADLVLRVGRLADALRDKGEAGLRTTTDMSRFEATLRAYCVGYLAAQRDAGSQ